MCAHTARRLWLEFALLPLLSLTGRAAPLTFRHALELAAQHSAAIADASLDQDDVYEDCADIGNPSLLRLALGSALGDSSNFQPDFTLQRLLVRSASKSLSKSAEMQREPAWTNDERRGYAVLCTAVAYAEWAKVNSQVHVLESQEIAAGRLLKIESQRVVKKIDDPAALTRAKLLSARTRLWRAEVDGSLRQVRKRLADLTGLPENEIEAVADSMPPLPDLTNTPVPLNADIKQLAPARDVAQLEQVASHTRRMQTLGLMALSKATLGDLLANYIAEEEKLDALLEMNFEFQKAQLELLQMGSQLEKWAFRDEALGAEVFTALAGEPATIAEASSRPSEPKKLRLSSDVQSIMVTPAVSALVTGQSQQYSAIAIYSDRSAKDVTSETVWQCSSSSDAIVSSAGLVTALATGQVTITATVSSVSQSRRITITADVQEGVAENKPVF